MPDPAFFRERPRRNLLAIDGGGIRGVIALEILIAIEDRLRKQLGRGDDFVLADHFDYIAGTSTGAIIAAALSLGFPTRKIREFYFTWGRKIFTGRIWWQRLYSKYTHQHLEVALKEAFGGDTTLGSEKLRTLLLVVMRNATTDSPWPLSNAPGAKYNQPELPDNNLNIPLWQLVRASTAAPTFFPAEEVMLGTSRYVFQDGAITTYNNPAWQLFTMATAQPYGVGWPTGEDRIHLVSVGTGKSNLDGSHLRAQTQHLLQHASTIPAALMNAAAEQQDLLCRLVGRCRFGAKLDSEIGDLVNPTVRAIPPQMTYWRFNPDLSAKSLADLGLSHLVPREIAALDGIDRIPAMCEVGKRYAERVVNSLEV
jgi:patatin-like phospholipase/acyl hydrolase